VNGRRLVPLALAITLLLAVVAITAGGRPLGSSGGGHSGLPGSFWDYLYTTVVILAVPLLICGVLASMFIRRRRSKPRSFWQSMWRVLIAYAVLAALELIVLPRLHFHLHGTTVHQRGHFRSGQNRRNGKHGTGTRSLQFQWRELVVVLSLLFVAAVAAIVALRRSRHDEETAFDAAPETLAAALDESLDDLRADPDLRRAIVAAYSRMERALAAAGIPRRPAETPLEYVERALLTLHTSAAAVRDLTDLFEWARFSHHEPEPSMRDEAIDALVAVRDELRTAELTPA
jgi:Domain of unknown function (DUF4129)